MIIVVIGVEWIVYEFVFVHLCEISLLDVMPK